MENLQVPIEYIILLVLCMVRIEFHVSLEIFNQHIQNLRFVKTKDYINIDFMCEIVNILLKVLRKSKEEYLNKIA